MDEQTLPERLRYLSTRFALREHVAETGDVLNRAADELARLARPAPTGEGARALLADLGELAAHINPAESGRDWRAVVLEARAALEWFTVAEAPDVGETEGRRFAASYLDPHAVGEEPLTFPTPAPGSFVLLGPVGSAWRVLAVDELAGHGSATHVLELEAVDPHDVPVRARVETVPMPVEELDADALYSVDGEGAGS